MKVDEIEKAQKDQDCIYRFGHTSQKGEVADKIIDSDYKRR